MELTTIVLSMLLTLPSAYTDKDEQGREQRLQTIAEAVSQASTRATCSGPYKEDGCNPIWPDDAESIAALVVTKGWWESRFARNVHEGRCFQNECDAIKLRNGEIKHLARSSWQFQRTAWSSPLWDHVVGTDLGSTRNAAWVATKILSEGYSRCRSYRGALSWYAVQRCDWSKVGNRYFTFVKLMEAKKGAQNEVADSS